MAPPAIGDLLPDVTLYKETPEGTVSLRELCAGKKVIIVGVPGAFTPVCSKKHIPAYAEKLDELKSKGLGLVVCVSVNDPFVMAAWGESMGVTGKVDMLADMHMKLTEALDVVLDAEPKLGNKRSGRYALLADDNVIKAFNVEENPGEATCSMADPMLEILKSLESS